MLTRILKSIKKRGARGFLESAYVDSMVKTERLLIKLRDHRSKFHFVDRSSGKKTLVIILAGYKPFLWPATLERIKKYCSKEMDVCIAVSGKDSTELQSMCRTNNWSYLSTTKNSPGIALNKAILSHPDADKIFMLDEDIFIGDGFFQLLLDGYQMAWQKFGLEPGFCAPLLNLNGISYLSFLKQKNLEAEYTQEFGTPILKCDGIPIHNSGAAAQWIWRQTLPFDQTVSHFSSKDAHQFASATRFSIGAILFTREFFNKIGGFRSSWKPATLGEDEDGICRDCVSMSRPIYVVENVLAGHFSFYLQEHEMRKYLPEMSLLDPITFPQEYYSKL